jgi:hypothetical protein
MTDPSLETGFICNSSEHWFAIRKVGGSWFNLNSLADGPKLVSDFYLSAQLESVKSEGFNIFVVRGDFPCLTREQFEIRQDNQIWYPLSMLVKVKADTYDLERAIQESLQGHDEQEEIQRAIEESLKANGEPVRNFGELEAEDDGPDTFELRVRLWDGKTLSRKFVPSSPLRKVKDWVQITTGREVRLSTSYPVTELTAFEASLNSLGIDRSNNMLRAERPMAA